MVSSLYIKNYLDKVRQWYKKQGFIFDNYNNEVENSYYVPKNQGEHMVDFFVREALSKSTKAQGEPFIFLGWNRSVINSLSGTRNHPMHRTIPTGDARITKTFREVQFDLGIFMVTNQGNVAEDLEEIFNAVIQPRSEYKVDMGSVFIMDYPEFEVNTQHSGAITSNPMLTTGNLWTVHYLVKITGPAIEFDERGMKAARAISVALYNMVGNEFLEEIKVEK